MNHRSDEEEVKLRNIKQTKLIMIYLFQESRQVFSAHVPSCMLSDCMEHLMNPDP